MTPFQIVAILALVGYAIYRQSIRHEVTAKGRFKLAIIYAIVGIVIGGFSRPDGAAEWGLLVLSLGLSFVVGLARGRYTRLWVEDEKVWSQGTALTIGLFVGLVVVKFAMGTWAYFAHVSDDGGFGEIMVMIAIMVAVQAQLIWRRVLAMPEAPASVTTPSSAG